LGSIAELTRLPAALFVVDILKEHIAVAEANKLGIPVFAMVDTNSDPTQVEFAIPANDDASKSISKILDVVCESVAEGLSERKADKEKKSAEQAKAEEAKKAAIEKKKAAAKKVDVAEEAPAAEKAKQEKSEG
jgi:small subunit ribosomal protein S2